MHVCFRPLVRPALAFAIVIPVFAPLAAAEPTTVPATQPMSEGNTNRFAIAMSREAHFSETGKKVNAGWNEMIHLVMDNTADVLNPTKQTEVLEKVRPVAKQLAIDAHQLATEQGNDAMSLDVAKTVDGKVAEYLAILGDEETLKSLEADIDGSDVDKAIRAQGVLLNRRLTLSGGSKPELTAVVNTLDKLAHEHADSVDLADFIYKLHAESGDPKVRDRLMGLLARVMTGHAAGRYAKGIELYNADAALKGAVGKPFVLAGKTADGKDLSTADYKGKVVLVDFWATWCGPCKAELPTIQKLYADNHDKGLEIVGVSNDFSLDALQKFTAEKQMPWPQVFDADAASKQTWNPITLANGVGGIPRLFIIDRSGNLLSSDARVDYEKLVTEALAK